MNLLFVVPDKEKDLGNLEFGGPEQASREDKKRVGRQEVVVQRRYKLFSDVQRADDIEVVIPAQAGEKHFAYMEPVQLVNPWAVSYTHLRTRVIMGMYCIISPFTALSVLLRCAASPDRSPQ